MVKLKQVSTILICLFIVLSTVGCTGESARNNGEFTSKPGNTFKKLPRQIIVEDKKNIKQDDIGIILEFISHTPQGLSFKLSNNSGYKIRLGDECEIRGKFGSAMGCTIEEFFELNSGKNKTIFAGVFEIEPGEYENRLSIIIDPDNKTNSRDYQLVSEFAIENTEIPPELRIVSMEVDADFNSPIGVSINISNGFDNGRLYFDKFYKLLHNDNGVWQEIPTIASNSFLYDTISLAPRQKLSIAVYWEWLYGKLPVGEYRIVKSFLHRSDDGRDIQYELYSTFSLDGSPLVDSVEKDDGMSWLHPFYSFGSLKAEVLKLVDSNGNYLEMDKSGLLVNALTPVLGDDVGGYYYVYNSFDLPILDSDGNHIRITDIKEGDVLEITHCGMILMSDPGILACPSFIKVE